MTTPAQRTLQSRQPDRTPPRVVTGPTLLTGLAVCETCGRGMMLRTGKSGQYRYLTCAKVATEGASQGCGRSVRMEVIDEMVLGAVEQRVFAPDRLAALLRATMEHSQSGLAALEEEMTQQNASPKEAKAGLKRLYDLVETGVTDVDDPLLKERITELKLRIREATVRIETLQQRRSMVRVEMTPAVLGRFASGMSQRLRDGNPALRRAWLHLFVDEVRVGLDQIVIRDPEGPIIDAVAMK